MELLVIKSDNGYLRFTKTDYECTGMSKASVYPLSAHNHVVEKYHALRGKLNGLKIKKLIITEENYDYEDTTKRSKSIID